MRGYLEASAFALPGRAGLGVTTGMEVLGGIPGCFGSCLRAVLELS